MNHRQTVAALTLGAAIGLLTACGGADAGTSPETRDAPAAASTEPATAPAPEPIGVTLIRYGAVCDGRFDNTEAIARGITAAKRQNHALLVPEGVCAYSDVIRLDGVKLIGTGDNSVLHALNPNRAAIFVLGSGTEVRSLRLAGVRPTTRMAPWETTRITALGATNFVIDNVTIEGAAGAGIHLSRAASQGVITNNRIKDTLADSIHITDRSHHITVSNNRIENSGDDGIAVVSYRNNGSRVNHITARNNVIVNNRWGRQMSVVGGSEVLYENNLLENNLAGAACLYVAQESGYATFGSHDVTLRRNTLRNCGGGTSEHGAVMVYSAGQEANTAITIERNEITQSRRGIRVISAMNNRVTVDSNRVVGAGTPIDLETPGVNFRPYTSGPIGYVAP